MNMNRLISKSKALLWGLLLYANMFRTVLILNSTHTSLIEHCPCFSLFNDIFMSRYAFLCIFVSLSIPLITIFRARIATNSRDIALPLEVPYFATLYYLN